MPPSILRTVAEMKRRSAEERASGRTIAFVPTMGALHRGHVSLLEAARRMADVVVLSIFVNPTQFGPKEDLSRYPRPFDADVAKAAAAGVDVVFAPEPGQVYPEGFQTYVDVREISQGLCGASRPGHFVGVATVVCKLFNMVRPDVALFGRKDYQQLQVIRRMARDLDLDVEIRGLPLIRDEDGIALSSRNVYLSPEERTDALTLSRALFAARDAFRSGERSAERLLSVARRILDDKRETVRVEYLELRDAEGLCPTAERLDRSAVLLIAARVGATRLIDNVILDGEEDE